MSLDVVNGVLAKLADDADLHDDLKQPQVQVVSALCVVCVFGRSRCSGVVGGIEVCVHMGPALVIE